MIQLTAQKKSQGSEQLLGSEAPAPVQVDQIAGQTEVILSVVDPDSGTEVEILYCTQLGSYYIDPYYRGREYKGTLLVSNHELLERLIRTDKIFNWVLTSTLGPRTCFTGKLETAPDLKTQGVTVRIRPL